jgi:DNA-directed RNA polymerase specialized sigma24 family protein
MANSNFPPTHSSILVQARDGNWEPFLREYLEPCWREVVLVCRGRGISIPDAEDLFQELMHRIMREGKFARRMRPVLLRFQQDPDFEANLVGRFLKYRELPFQSVRFRTYLKGVIAKLVQEALRQKRQNAQPLDVQAVDAAAGWMDESISLSIDRPWIVECLNDAAKAFWNECRQAKTKGRRRWFELLYLAVVERLTSEQIAERLGGLTADAVRHELKRAKPRFRELLREFSKMDDEQELKGLIRRVPGALKQALTAARSKGG